MNLVDFLFYLAAGKLLTWLVQINGPTRELVKRYPLLLELYRCDLCLGFWVYLGLAVCLEPPLRMFPSSIQRLILAAIASFMAHLLGLGWQSKFGVTVIE